MPASRWVRVATYVSVLATIINLVFWIGATFVFGWAVFHLLPGTPVYLAVLLGVCTCVCGFMVGFVWSTERLFSTRR